MEHLTTLFKLLEITRLQPQYGYVLAGVSKSDLSDLAQHHYLVAMLALMLAKHMESKGVEINTQKVLEIALVHDLGELFGGDINFYYSRSNLKAREKAKAFEAENIEYLSKLFGKYGEDLKANTEMFEAKGSNEAILAQCADKLELVHYKLMIGKIIPEDISSAKESVLNYSKKSTNDNFKKELENFIEQWAKEMPGKSILETMAGEIKEYN